MEIRQKELDLKEKLRILSDAAKYDAACTSSGVDRPGKPGELGNSVAAGICHSFAADGRCISLLKILLTNHCIFDCKYCMNRRSNDIERAAFTADEICTLTIEFYRRNYIEGLFLSSGIMQSPDHTMEQIYEVLYKLRIHHRFRGYIHVKAIPGADGALLDEAGYLADRMSVNLELPTAESLRALAPHKTRDAILKPMRRIQTGIEQARLSMGQTPRLERAYGVKHFRNGIFRDSGNERLGAEERAALPGHLTGRHLTAPRSFVPAGQSTQIIVGATRESDYQMMMVAQALYRQYDLKRVFFSAYVGLNEDSSLPAPGGKPPLLREHRLYQADWLLRYYGFRAEELLSEERPNFNVLLDPKCDWAVRHLEYFPVEIMKADYERLLRVPGIGAKSARRILQARKFAALDFPDLKKLGVVLKRAHYFIVCQGRQMYPVRLEENRITAGLISDSQKKNWQIEYGESFRQLNLFDDMKLEAPPTVEDFRKAAAGQL